LDQETDLTKGFDQHFGTKRWGFTSLGLRDLPKTPRDFETQETNSMFQDLLDLLGLYFSPIWGFHGVPIVLYLSIPGFLDNAWLSFGAIRCAWRKLAARPRPGKAAKSFQKN